MNAGFRLPELNVRLFSSALPDFVMVMVYVFVFLPSFPVTSMVMRVSSLPMAIGADWVSLAVVMPFIFIVASGSAATAVTVMFSTLSSITVA
ncbi:MAG: hypothetical protein A4E55_01222 [Pelotomaculum sp. PtaU1.Bin035]|nr:MAG: hypothetical protein A4E55_01222 [Pelotomaculum sp. PtaU1.Bin035]